MSVVVRMEMPENCAVCPFVTEYSRCVFLGMFAIDEERRADNCPIVCSLPEGHGRLIDADAYSAEMKDRQDAAWKWRNEAIAEEDEVKLARAEGAFSAFVEAKLTWDKQATIVPAERS